MRSSSVSRNDIETHRFCAFAPPGPPPRSTQCVILSLENGWSGLWKFWPSNRFFTRRAMQMVVLSMAGVVVMVTLTADDVSTVKELCRGWHVRNTVAGGHRLAMVVVM